MAGDSPLGPAVRMLPGLAPNAPVPCVGMFVPEELLPQLQNKFLIKAALNHK